MVPDLKPPLGTSLGETAWPDQFCISKDKCPVPLAWKTVELLGWHFQHSPDLRYAQLLDKSGDAVGWLIGMATLEGRMIGDTFTVDTPSDLDALGGGWAAVHLGWQRVYVDSFGHLSLVFAEGGGGISTNPEFFENRQENADLRQLIRTPEEDNWYPFGLTPWKNVRRLTPNHFLCLESGIDQRHWPDRATIESCLEEISLDEACDIIIKTIKDNIAAVSAEYPIKVSLTAGFDSRTVLACARQYRDKLECVTHELHPVSGKLDLAVARRLSRKNQLALTELPIRQSTSDQKALFLRRTAGLVGGASYAQIGTLCQDDNRAPTLTGHGAEILKGFCHPEDTDIQPSAAELVRAIYLPANEEILKAAEKWLQGLVHLGASPSMVWDLLYPEQEGAGWAGVLRHGTPRAMGFWAFSNRNVVKMTLRLPASQKKQRAIHLRIIEREWPELLEVPINKWWGLRGQFDRGKRVIKRLGKKFR